MRQRVYVLDLPRSSYIDQCAGSSYKGRSSIYRGGLPWFSQKNYSPKSLSPKNYSPKKWFTEKLFAENIIRRIIFRRIFHTIKSLERWLKSKCHTKYVLFDQNFWKFKNLQKFKIFVTIIVTYFSANNFSVKNFFGQLFSANNFSANFFSVKVRVTKLTYLW